MPSPTGSADPPYSRGEAGYSGWPSYHFYASNLVGVPVPVALTTTFQEFQFNDTRPQPDGSTIGLFLSTGVIISNDSNANYIEFSFDGVTVHGRLLFTDTLNFGLMRERQVWLRGQAGAEPYRVFAW